MFHVKVGFLNRKVGYPGQKCVFPAEKDLLSVHTFYLNSASSFRRVEKWCTKGRRRCISYFSGVQLMSIFTVGNTLSSIRSYISTPQHPPALQLSSANIVNHILVNGSPTKTTIIVFDLFSIPVRGAGVSNCLHHRVLIPPPPQAPQRQVEINFKITPPSPLG